MPAEPKLAPGTVQILGPLSPKTGAPVNVENYEAQDPVMCVRHPAGDVLYSTPGRVTQWRVQTLFTKEPDTIAWLDGFAKGEVFADIGANVGMYSLYAARLRGARVFAFEPEAQNFAVLNKNIFINEMAARVTAFPIALSDAAGVDLLHLAQMTPGGSCHNYGEARDAFEQPVAAVFRQGCAAYPLDTLVAGGVLPVPNHIKVDVDGIEPKVVAGMRKTLADRQVRSVLIEINTALDSHQRILQQMRELSFTCNEAEAARARRTEGHFKGVGNVIFRR